MATLVVQLKDVLDNMSDKDIKVVLEELKSLGYKVSTIMCGECDKDDLLVELHTCHSEIENILLEPDGLHPTTDLI